MKYYTLLLIIALITIGNLTICGQSKAVNRDKYQIHITYTDEKIDLDGLFDEEIWKVAEKTGKFQRVTPTDTGYAIAQTTVRVAYDAENLYLAAICYDLSR